MLFSGPGAITGRFSLAVTVGMLLLLWSVVNNEAQPLAQSHFWHDLLGPIWGPLGPWKPILEDPFRRYVPHHVTIFCKTCSCVLIGSFLSTTPLIFWPYAQPEFCGIWLLCEPSINSSIPDLEEPIRRYDTNPFSILLDCIGKPFFHHLYVEPTNHNFFHLYSLCRPEKLTI